MQRHKSLTNLATLTLKGMVLFEWFCKSYDFRFCTLRAFYRTIIFIHVCKQFFLSIHSIKIEI